MMVTRVGDVEVTGSVTVSQSIIVSEVVETPDILINGIALLARLAQLESRIIELENRGG